MAKKRKETPEERAAWESLYQYVKKDIMGYDENQALSKGTVLRLKGLLTNKFMANNNIESTANYSYETILNTFKYCYPSIQKALRTNSWNGEQHKVNYIFKIVERNINDVYIREKSVKKAKEEVKRTTLDSVDNKGAEYQRKTKDITNKMLDDLW